MRAEARLSLGGLALTLTSANSQSDTSALLAQLWQSGSRQRRQRVEKPRCIFWRSAGCLANLIESTPNMTAPCDKT